MDGTARSIVCGLCGVGAHAALGMRISLIAALTALLSTTSGGVAVAAASQTRAYATLITGGEDYIFGAEVLAKALRATGSLVPLVCLVSTDLMPPSLSGRGDGRPVKKQQAEEAARKEMLDRLRLAGYAVRFVTPIANPNTNLERKWFQSTFTKLHVFNLTQFDRVVYLDTDVLVLSNLDHLFALPIEHIAAAPDMLPPDKMQSVSTVTRTRPRDSRQRSPRPLSQTPTPHHPHGLTPHSAVS